MPFYRRSFLYLIRKRAKSVLLLLIFLLVNSMILGTNMILRAAENTETAMEEKAGVKVVCEVLDTAHPITEEEAEAIQNTAEVTRVNRMGQQTARLTDLAPVTASDSTELENQQVILMSYDDMETDGPFADQSYRLTEGELIGPDTRYGAVINAGLADANGLELGDTFSLETEKGGSVAVTVIGKYFAGNESRQEDAALAVYRVENQIYVDNAAYQELFGGSGFYKIAAYTGQPGQLSALAEKIRGILKEKADITTSDALYQQMKAPLTQITRAVALMRLLAFVTGTALVSLLLCMWMRSRQKEMAIFISLGEPRYVLFLQALMEAAAVFFLALLGAGVLGRLAAGRLQGLLTAASETGLSLQVSLEPVDLALLLCIGGGVAVIAVLVSLLPVLLENPKDLLSRMEG